MLNPEAQTDLMNRFHAYFAKRGYLPSQIPPCFIPMFHDDPRAQLATGWYVKKRKDQRLSNDLPGFLIWRNEEYVSFRYLCDEEDYPVDGSHKPVKLLNPRGYSVPPFFTWKGPVEGIIVINEAVVKAYSPKLKRVRKCTIGLNGVRSGVNKDKKLVSELQRIAPGNEFEITWDAGAHKGHFCYNSDIGKHMRELARLLYAHGATKVTIVIVPPESGRYDQGLDDWLAVDGNEYENLTRYELDEDGSTKSVPTSLSDFVKEDLKRAIPLIDNLINLGECNMLVGPPKCGKTRIAMTMALAVAAGQQNIFGHPEFGVPQKTGVLLVLLEDQRVDIQHNLAKFAESMGITTPVKDLELYVLTFLDEGSLIEHKIDSYLKQHPNIQFIILDNHTVLERISGRAAPEGGLTQREYSKMERYTQIARKHNVAVMILVHAKKNSTKSQVISDKTNSTGTASGAVDNLNAIDFIQAQNKAEEYRRVFSTQARSHKSYSIILDVAGDCAPLFIGDQWEFNLAARQREYLGAVNELVKKAGDADAKVTSKQVAEHMGKTENNSTVRLTLGKLIEKGWLNSEQGAGGGYVLSERAQKLLLS